MACTEETPEEINVDVLISEIKKRPVLYNKNAGEISKEAKSVLWCEIGQALFKRWNVYKFNIKLERVREAQAKWKTLKEMFIKHRLSPRLMNAAGRIKKKYRYFEKMEFLVPLLENENNNDIATISSTAAVAGQLANLPSTSSAGMEPPVAVPGSSDAVNDNPGSLPNPNGNQLQPVSVQLPDGDQLDLTSNPFNPNEMDDISYFSLMLVSMMRKLTEERKYYAQTEILRIMRQAHWLGQIPPDDDMEDVAPLRPPSPGGGFQPVRIPALLERNEGDIEMPNAAPAPRDEPQPGPSRINDDAPLAGHPFNRAQRAITILHSELVHPDPDSD
ncbi:uncharacterized protein LOC113494266 [Trichoplusia ni]|uniref:Uncharacterized protein LOC113494266 n=1 Tax=Trichoplusia ni TaxID=7111 RepID=A0A7E5VJ59_TRINI|nr:uncharacterized protein LOC113494266 [Trichoplusia ni]XP_026728335.1 uncharacterized protein LOC113494266 [Trichoplusia ni]